MSNGGTGGDGQKESGVERGGLGAGQGGNELGQGALSAGQGIQAAAAQAGEAFSGLGFPAVSQIDPEQDGRFKAKANSKGQ
jgi:hypothetical protein